MSLLGVLNPVQPEEGQMDVSPEEEVLIPPPLLKPSVRYMKLYYQIFKSMGNSKFRKVPFFKVIGSPPKPNPSKSLIGVSWGLENLSQ